MTADPGLVVGDVDAPPTVRRLNWGCGNHPEPGWINSDLKDATGVDLVGDIRHGLPIDDDHLDYVVSVHALPMIPYPEVVPVLDELRRVLRPGGTLRLALPDLDAAIAAYQRRDRDHFLVPDADEDTVSGKFIVHMLWYGYSVTLFTPEFARSVLMRAGFGSVHNCAFHVTASDHAGITDLDNREHETFFIEAVK